MTVADQPNDWLAIVAFSVAGVLAGIILGAVFHASAPATPARSSAEQMPTATRTATNATTPAKPAKPAAPTDALKQPAARSRRDMKALSGALSKGASDVRRQGLGTAEVALMLDRDVEPVVRGAAPDQPVRVWSMIKPVTAVALLTALDGDARGLDPYLRAALRRSENCAQRKLVLELQRVEGGIDAAKLALRDTLTAVGGELDTKRAQISANGRDCQAPGYDLLSNADAARRSLFAGTTNWRIADAARFAHALRGERVFGKSISDRILGLMREPKLPSREPGADGRTTAPLDWGAGATFRAVCWHVAYKGGWGRNTSVPFTAGQLGTVELGNGRWAAFAVVFHPAKVPPDSDPGKADAPQGLAVALAPLKRKLQRQFPGACNR